MLWWLTVLAIAGALVAFAGALFRWLGREERGDDRNGGTP